MTGVATHARFTMAIITAFHLLKPSFSFLHAPKVQPLRSQVHSLRIEPNGRLLLRSLSTLLTLEDGVHQDEQTIKKSRFIGMAENCSSWEDAQEFVRFVRQEHPKARHVCFGWVAGNNPVQERASDDGEPTGTAGAPIIGAIKGEGLCDVICTVVRYSGGIKLGAGGLIRAYGGAARLALRVGPKKVLIPKSAVRVSTSAANSGSVYDAARRYNAVASGENYNDAGRLEMTIVCETQCMKDMMERIKDATRGDVVFLE